MSLEPSTAPSLEWSVPVSKRRSRMLRIRILLLLFTCASCGFATDLQQELQTKYPITVVDENGFVVRKGCILTVQYEGIVANPIFGDLYWPNTFKNGRVSRFFIVARNGSSQVSGSLVVLKPGDRVYITRINVNDKKVIFRLQMCPGCTPGKSASRIYRAELSFPFPGSQFRLEPIEITIAALLINTDYTPPSISNSFAPPGATAYPTSRASSNSAAAVIHAGQSMDEVKGLIGEPESVQTVSDGVLFLYPGLTVTFMNGVVTNVRY